MAKAKQTRKRVSPEQFVKAYQTSENTTEVASKLGISLPSVFAKRKLLVGKGVKLKKMGRAKQQIDVAALNKLIEKLGK